jgi:hypothetical protein
MNLPNEKDSVMADTSDKAPDPISPESVPPNAAAPDPSLADMDRLRAAIDRGQMRDKVAVSDPAASPLGTDDEASQLHDEEGLKIARAAKPPK